MPSPSTFWKSKFPRLRYSFVWLAFSLMRVAVMLPLRLQLGIGAGLGHLCYWLIPGRRAVAQRNIAVCFPELPESQRSRLVRHHFAALGMSVAEMAMGWFGNRETVDRHVEIEGIENLTSALEAGSGVILFSAHFTTFEMFFPALRRHCPRLSGMYKVQRNPLMNEIMNEGRGRNFDCLIPKENVRDMLRELKSNTVFWYASDQKYAGKNSELIPFFGVPAMTNTAICRIAASTGAVVLPYFCRRLPGTKPAYVATIGTPLSQFGQGEPSADIGNFVTLLEAHIRQCPEQYWWIHQRFKGRPESLPDIYSRQHTSG